jgi:hypothetical protein
MSFHNMYHTGYYSPMYTWYLLPVVRAQAVLMSVYGRFRVDSTNSNRVRSQCSTVPSYSSVEKNLLVLHAQWHLL